MMTRAPVCVPHGSDPSFCSAVLQLLGLRGCADTLVGGEEVKGISGGEKRRVSLALQMLLDPPVLLLYVCHVITHCRPSVSPH